MKTRCEMLTEIRGESLGTVSENSSFEEKFQNYKTSKGAIQFPFTQDLPWNLIQEITEFRKNKI